MVTGVSKTRNRYRNYYGKTIQTIYIEQISEQHYSDFDKHGIGSKRYGWTLISPTQVDKIQSITMRRGDALSTSVTDHCRQIDKRIAAGQVYCTGYILLSCEQITGGSRTSRMEPCFQTREHGSLGTWIKPTAISLRHYFAKEVDNLFLTAKHIGLAVLCFYSKTGFLALVLPNLNRSG